MKYKLLSFLFAPIIAFSQTGPAGVGTSSGTNRLWLKADANVYNNAGITLASNGNGVQQWNDRSGNGNNSSQATVGNRPVFVTNAINGNPALLFTGNTFVDAGALGILGSGGSSHIIVFKDTASNAGNISDGNGDFLVDRPTASNELASLKIITGNVYAYQKRTNAGGGLGGPASITVASPSAYHIINYMRNRGVDYRLYYDGIMQSSVVDGDGDITPPAPRLGRHATIPNNGLKGYIAEFIVYDYRINNAQINIVNNYLSAKYNIPLAAAVDFYGGDIPANGDYDFEVAGIGREASAAAINTQAASSISGGLDVLQGATALENNEYVMFGHQSGSNYINFTDIGGMSGGPSVGRWNRIWYIDWTHVGGTAENANLTFDLSDSGMPVTPSAPLTNYKLLYRAGLTGNWSEVASATSIAGDRISFNSISYNTRGDGYYTIGTLDNSISPLPVELTRFVANVCNKDVCLDWTTSTEINNDYFTIERSANGTAFEPVGELDAAGTSTVILNYSMLDENPFGGLSYYRLKQTDFNGGVSYSSIEAVNISADEFTLEVFPNPTDGNTINLTINSPVGEEVLIVIYDVTGKENYSKVIVTGNTNDTIYAFDPTTKLAPGVYMILASSKQAMVSKRLAVK